MSSLRVAILWHQHQPYYKQGNSYLLPWARLHATKDYYDMAAALEPFPSVRQTINVVPSLLVQLIDYVENGATDLVLDLTLRPATELTDEEKRTILRYFFLCNIERMILPYPRYAELYAKGKGNRDDMAAMGNAATAFSARDWLDLQVWYNLTWIGEYSRADEPFASLLAKGGDFTEEDKRSLIEASKGIIAKVIPTYKRMMESGQLELSVTPFYHPILPILCDSFTALEAMPNITLPEHHIRYPEDARVHIDRALRLFHERFGTMPRGMWPSEGSVSDEALALIREAGLQWVATDEGILRKTLGEGWSPLARYFPYTLKTRNGPLWLLFRDHELSDAIGFVYSQWDPAAAALDFYNRLIEIRTRIIQQYGADALERTLVPVILDGENCWEFYERNGRPFLEALYKLFAESSEITTTTIGSAIEHLPADRDRTLGRIFAGSWVGSNFKIWIGHEEDNRAWDALAEARDMLMEAKPYLSAEQFEGAMEEIYIAEGSDWFWWFGDENSTANQDDFDDLFRMHLRQVYILAGKQPPSHLDDPIRRAAHAPKVIPPARPISPTIDGIRADHEWEGAGYFIVEQVGGAMHRADAFERRIWFGADGERLFIRFDTTMPLGDGDGIRLSLAGRRNIIIHFTPGSVAVEVTTGGEPRIALTDIVVAAGETLEAAIPLSYLRDTGGSPAPIGLACELYEHGRQVERFPHQGEVGMEV